MSQEARAVCDFDGTEFSSACLSFARGQRLQVFPSTTNGGWVQGSVTPSTELGWLPASFWEAVQTCAAGTSSSSNFSASSPAILSGGGGSSAERHAGLFPLFTATINPRCGNRRRTEIRNGGSIWHDFCNASGVLHPSCRVVVMLDHHGVIDTMTPQQARHTGVDLDHCNEVTTLMCSFGRQHRRDAMNTRAAYHSMVAECDGHIFTDYPSGHHRSVDVYREPWMGSNCVGVRGDKGQVAELMRKLVLLFDDNEENIDLLRLRSSSESPLDGVLVRRGKKAGRSVPPGYLCENDPREWVQICIRFGRAYSSDVTGDGPQALHGHTVKYFVDKASALDPVPPSLRQADTQKIKDEIEVDTFRLRQFSQPLAAVLWLQRQPLAAWPHEVKAARARARARARAAKKASARPRHGGVRVRKSSRRRLRTHPECLCLPLSPAVGGKCLPFYQPLAVILTSHG